MSNLSQVGNLGKCFENKHDFYKKLPYVNNQYFDCIIFNDSLEHLYNPWEVLEYCKLILKNNGYIVCSLPNVRHIGNLLNLIFNKNWKKKREWTHKH